MYCMGVNGKALQASYDKIIIIIILSYAAREPGNEANKPHEFNDPLALLILNRTTGRYTPDSTVYKVLP